MAVAVLCLIILWHRDTSEYTVYLNKVVNYGYIYQFAFQYTDKNRQNTECH